MTGQELIDCIHKYHLEDAEILRLDENNGVDGDFLKFSMGDPPEYAWPDYKVLWLHDDYYQDVIFNHAGELTYGVNDG